MDTIGDVAYVVLLGIVASPDAGEHLLGDPSVELRDAVDFLTSVASKSGHAELLVLVVGISAAHADEFIPCDAKALGIGSHILAEEPFVEVVVASGHGCVDGVESAGTYELHGLVEGQMVFLDVVAKALEVAKSGMAFVAMVDIFADAQLLERENAANAEQDFLLQAVLPVAAVERVCDGFVVLRVHLVVGVKQIELDSADVDTPDVGVDKIVVIGDGDDHGLAVVVELSLNGQVGEVLGFILSNLLSVHGEALREIAETIEESDGAEINIRVGSFLEVVAGEHAETAGVNLEGGVHAVLHREVGHGGTLLVGLDVHVVTEELIDALDALHEGLVVDDGFLAWEAESLKEHHRVVLDVMIEFGVEVAEEVAGFVVPHPP